MKPPVRKSKKTEIKCITFSEAFRLSGNAILAQWVHYDRKADTRAYMEGLKRDESWRKYEF